MKHMQNGDARTLTAVPGSDNGSLKSKVLFNAAVRF